jgi:hypothetical protein
LININRNVALQRKGMEIATFLPIPRWEMLLETTDSRKAQLKGYRKATRKCSKAIR